MNPDNEYEEQNDFSEDSAGDQGDNFYASRTAQHQIPIQKDEGPIEDPIDTTTVDSDAQLGKSLRPTCMNV